MFTPNYLFARLRELIGEYEPSEELSIAAVKLAECEKWLSRSTPTAGLAQRTAAASAVQVPAAAILAQHSWTPDCDGFPVIGSRPAAPRCRCTLIAEGAAEAEPAAGDVHGEPASTGGNDGEVPGGE